MSNALRNTALFATLLTSAKSRMSPSSLSSINTDSRRTGHPSNLFLTPIQSLFDGSHEEIAARFPDAPAEVIESLLSDYEVENDLLREALSTFGLESYCDEISRLFSNDTAEEGMME